MFVGKFDHTFDDKGRVVLPSTLRANIPEGGYVTRLDGCVAIFNRDGFEGLVSRLRERVRGGEATQKSLRQFTSAAREMRPDSQGRVSVPQELRDYAELDRDVIVVGADDRIELWNPDRWSDIDDDDTDDDFMREFRQGL